ncbi:hypothetical protein ACQKKX_02665 [Neorhizobium sp. NPDC001467]|uniref:sunset domain-containing protein n=1 Tax=Neorhizobium sp. NPDC001467 TaxID=3390595 RepID=UPI003D04108C
MSNFAIATVLISGSVFMATGGYTLLPRSTYDPACDIKGNISWNGGQKIYHVRGQKNYQDTRIRVLDGERWFCSEDEARAAGWRKAGR